MKMFELRVPFFVPLWRRIALTGFCFAWAGVELLYGAPTWALLVGALGAFAAWQFFFTGWPAGAAGEPGED